MGKLSQLKKQVSGAVWVKAQTLSDIEAVFAIKSVNRSTNKLGGEQWNLEIDIHKDSLPDPDMSFGGDTGDKVMVSLGCGARDDLMKLIQQNTPVDNCFIDSVPMENGNNFFDVVELDESHELYHETVEQLPKQTAKKLSTNRRGTRKVTNVEDVIDHLGELEEHPF